jgi:hypothetical protein
VWILGRSMCMVGQGILWQKLMPSMDALQWIEVRDGFGYRTLFPVPNDAGIAIGPG